VVSGIAFVDVHTYGAVGDGTTDDRAAIVLAIAAAATSGIVFFRPGKTYRITNVLAIAYDDQTWLMDGATIKLDYTGPAITIGTTTIAAHRVKLQGGLITSMSGTHNWTAGTVGIQLLRCNNCVLRDVSVTFLEKGIEVTSPACRGGQVSYAGTDPSATGRYAVTITHHASSFGNVNGTKFYGTYFGCSLSGGNRPGAFYIDAVGTMIHACHCENFPDPKVTPAGDALVGGLPNMIWGGGADWLDPEADLAAGTTGLAAPWIYSGQDGAGVSGCGQHEYGNLLGARGWAGVLREKHLRGPLRRQRSNRLQSDGVMADRWLGPVGCTDQRHGGRWGERRLGLVHQLLHRCRRGPEYAAHHHQVHGAGDVHGGRSGEFRHGWDRL
jgi:hypothetical protein